MAEASRPVRSRASLGIVYLTVFIDLLGFGIILPSLPFYAQDLGATGLWLGVLLTSYSFAQLIGAAILGRLSDRFGRRPMLILSLAGSSASLALTGLALSLPTLAAARALAGLFGGSVSAAQAYIADVTEPHERARYMGILGSAIGLGFVLGPAIGALLSPLGFGAAAFAAAGLAAANCVFALFRLRESLDPEDRSQAAAQRSLAYLRRAMRRPGLARILLASFLTMFAFVAMETTLAYLGKVRFGLDERGFGLLLVLVGGVMILVQGGLIGPLTRRWGERRLALAGAVIMTISLLAVPSAQNLGMAALILAPLGAGRALTLPTIATLISRRTPREEQGGTLGLAQSLNAAARAVGPLLAGWLYDFGPARPFVVAGTLSVLAALCLAERGERADG
jgi:DHA1 family tetracycline resistance protein-like MFS transporter